VASVVVVAAVAHLRWWSMASGTLLILGAILSSCKRGRALVLGAAAVACCAGAMQIINAYHAVPADALTRHEAEQVYERSLAHWLKDRAGPDDTLLLAPPLRTPSLVFYGGLRGIGSQNWENRDGLAMAFRIAGSPESGEAKALLNQRGVTHIVLPSWDRDLSDFARLSLPDEKRSFVYQLEHWTVFDWIRPLPYRVPNLGGTTEPTVVVLQVVEPSNRAIAISRTAEYFIEMEHLEVAELALPALREFPADLGALLTIAQLERARGDQKAFRQAFDTVVAGLTARSDRFLPWDRRVNLAALLELGGRRDLAQAQVERCWKEATPARLRSLSTAELYRLLVLGKSHGLEFTDPQMQSLARNLLPLEARERF